MLPLLSGLSDSSRPFLFLSVHLLPFCPFLHKRFLLSSVKLLYTLQHVTHLYIIPHESFLSIPHPFIPFG
ncbi:hypothetical protein GIB67_004210 [Kingdonia uniflora]|uniref:Uncharacterized protein n=1 Tax=Kingdonia uniflora TaxID=39325 RepID=A0A7J7P0X7_9MAGN|nr:hypothetical protein GIB67_004210 [Kingdonia uniflora]